MLWKSSLFYYDGKSSLECFVRKQAIIKEMLRALSSPLSHDVNCQRHQRQLSCVIKDSSKRILRQNYQKIESWRSMGARLSPVYKCILWGELITMLYHGNNGTWIFSLQHWQDGVVVVLSEWHDISRPPDALLFLQNPVTEVPRGETGRPSC